MTIATAPTTEAEEDKQREVASSLLPTTVYGVQSDCWWERVIRPDFSFRVSGV
jgi:hypothetical protein